jgi:nucleoside-diphosphate-sugar epimerase
MTTLITGAGLVGSLAAARLIAEPGERPVLYDVAFSMGNVAERVPLDRVDLVRGDLAEVGDLARAIQQYRVERIIHTAGFLTWMVRERPAAGVRVNLVGTLNVLEAARITGVKRVVFCSSSTVYMGLRQPPPGGTLSEDFALHAVGEYPPSVYASMKLAAEWLGHNYTNEYGLDVVSVRFGGVFGPWHGTPSGGPSQLLQQLVESAWYGRPAQIGAGDVQRGGMDYVYASDAAQGVVRAALAADVPNRVYNIAMGELYTVREIIALLERLTGRQVALDLYEQGSRAGYSQATYPADISRARDELGYVVEFPMEAALRDYWSWLERQPAGTAAGGQHAASASASAR